MNLKIAIIAILTSCLFFSCGPKEQPVVKMTPEQLKNELEFKESQTPLKFVSHKLKIKDRKTREAGLFRDAQYDGYILYGTISNTASVAQFKDFEITISYYSKTNSVIEQQKITIYEILKAGQSKEVSQIVPGPDTKIVQAVDVEVSGALSAGLIPN